MQGIAGEQENMRRLASVLFFTYFFASSAVLVIPAAIICVLTFLFDRNRRLLHYFSCAWGYHYMYINPFWRCHFEGKENIDPNKTYVLIANHQSSADILVIYGLFKPYKWVSKESVFDVPFIGWNLRLNQAVCLKRGDIKSIKNMMRECRAWLDRQASVMLFPEGTRSPDGELQQFRDGAFRLSCESKLPLIPIVINGTHDLLSKHGREVDFRARLDVKILPPIDPAEFEYQTPRMRDYVHGLMKTTLVEMRKREGATNPKVVVS